MQEDITTILELSRLLSKSVFPELDEPFAFVFFPVAADDLGRELHVLAEIEGVADLVQVLPDVRRVREESGPVGI